MKRVWVFVPPRPVVSGGMRVLVQVARQLRAQGALAGVLCWEEPLAEASDLPWQAARSAPLAAGDVLVVPEGWPGALTLGVRAGCRLVVYCQNWAYLFHGLAEGVRWQDLPVEFLAVSQPVAWYIEQVTGKAPAVVRPAIDRSRFHPPAAFPVPHPLRVAFMPRKNKAMAEGVRRIVAERNPHLAWQWIPIHGLDPAGVAEVLRSCPIFLATGFPEGCPLPPLEALACGCLVVGTTGFGGWDYARPVEPEGMLPQGFSLRPVPWGGNGWWVADGDMLGAALALERAAACLEVADACRKVRAAAWETAAAYDADHQAAEVAAWVRGL